MKHFILSSLVVMSSLSAFASEEVNYQMYSCRVIDQSGTLDSWACRNSPHKIRCYADIELENGSRTTVYGGCYPSYSDCWSLGEGAVNACD